MFRKLALAGTISLALVGLARAANAPTYQDPVGQTRDAQGVVLVDTTGAPYKAATTGGGAVTEADGANVTLGAKADAKSTATDTTAVTLMSVNKQISASTQAAAASLAGALTVGTHAVTQSGTWTVTPAVTGNGTAATSQRVTIASDSTGVVGLNAGSAIVGKVGIDQTTPGTTNGVQVNAALPAGTALIGKVGIDQTTSGTTNAVVPLATENHVGEVGNNEITLTAAITSTVVTYTTGQSIGGLLTITNAARVSGSAGAAGTSGLIQKAVLGSTVTNTVQVDVIYFNANPSGSTCTNAAAYSLAAADRSKVIGFAHITDWEASAVAYSGQAQNLAIPYALVSATSIFACVVARGSIVGASTSDFTLDTGVIRN
jgi:hypothetical protein